MSRLNAHRLGILAGCIVGEPVRVNERGDLLTEKSAWGTAGWDMTAGCYLVELDSSLANNSALLLDTFAHELGHIRAQHVAKIAPIDDEDENSLINAVVTLTAAVAARNETGVDVREREADELAREILPTVGDEARRRWGVSFGRAVILW